MSDIEIGSVWLGKPDSIRPNDRIKVTKIKVWEDGERNILFEYLDKLGAGSDREVVFLEQFEKQDMVNHPPHYKDASGIECIEVTKHMRFCGGNCFKYLYRAGKKGSTIEDLKKAIWYAERAWENEEVVLITPMRLIEQIAVHREGNIKEAMLYVAEDFWAMAKRSIEAEIARLESE